jgi:hypothetical protein
MTATSSKTCIYADRHNCGDREAHPYMTSGGYACDLHKPGAGTLLPPDTRPQTRIVQVLDATVIDWAPNQTGPCARCTVPCRRYGVGGNPLCATCRPTTATA